MMQKQKKFLAIVLAICLMAVVFAVPAFAEGLAEFPALPKNVCVVDDADMLSSDTEAWLDGLNGTLQKECKGATIAVLTVQDTGALSTADYATQAFNEWGVGDKDKNNGVLVLLCRTSPKFADGDYYVALGKGLDGTQLSSELKTMLNKNMEKPFVKGNYDTAVKDTVKAIEVAVRDQYGQGTFVHNMWKTCKEIFSEIAGVLEDVFGVVYIIGLILVVIGTIVVAIACFVAFLYHKLRGDFKEGKSLYSDNGYSSSDRYSSHHSSSNHSRSGGSFGGMGGGSSFGGGAGRG